MEYIDLKEAVSLKELCVLNNWHNVKIASTNIYLILNAEYLSLYMPYSLDGKMVVRKADRMGLLAKNDINENVGFKIGEEFSIQSGFYDNVDTQEKVLNYLSSDELYDNLMLSKEELKALPFLITGIEEHQPAPQAVAVQDENTKQQAALSIDTIFEQHEVYIKDYEKQHKKTGKPCPFTRDIRQLMHKVDPDAFTRCKMQLVESSNPSREIKKAREQYLPKFYELYPTPINAQLKL